LSHSEQFLGPSAAARRLGISTKALRHYEQRGLLTPVRSEAGWRTYGPTEMAQAAEIVALRALGLSLVQVERVREGEPGFLEPALASHQDVLEGRIRKLTETSRGFVTSGPTLPGMASRTSVNLRTWWDRRPR
jgi:DNA-binding transcriptional MerR regulator